MALHLSAPSIFFYVMELKALETSRVVVSRRGRNRNSTQGGGGAFSTGQEEYSDGEITRIS